MKQHSSHGIFTSLIVIKIVCTQEWNYHELAEDMWPYIYVSCGSTQQSPIDIQTSNTKYSKFETFKFSADYDTLINFTLQNNHYSIRTFDSIQEKLLTLEGGGLPGTFTFRQFHIHWGENIHQGSEHQVNGKKFSGEIHFVYLNFATNQTAVLSFLIEVINNQTLENEIDYNTTSLWHSYIEKALLLNGGNITYFMGNLSEFIPVHNLSKFYRYYNGSLTVPPCSGNVIWTIFNNTIKFLEDDITALHKIITDYNFREIQPLNGRIVSASFRDDQFDTGQILRIKQWILFIYIIIIYFPNY
ncbi:unnamed protein product [Didymodactylos carnosus]|uniref:Carbonic anhydrase n=1 Tax=Didymodactylos carnosus TaxID=1234261 RepID=A0A814A6B9_9BILA|nr:unnamed protein product [Didymodactylos carnosus]CAF0908592.1 unnamed protein product [Didymodactylos carnosus]CAF3595221.1 unnamed protein product [Didymodactylos carnosus]CAF3690064.1 unnamed protein product [Didymodactylos carnosus]